MDSNRLALLVAVLEKKAGLHPGAGYLLNVRRVRPKLQLAADLAMLLAVASSHLDHPVAAGAVVFGEVGLAGEVRAVNQPNQGWVRQRNSFQEVYPAG